MPLLQNTYSILFETFVLKDTSRVQGGATAVERAILSDRQRKFDLLLGQKSRDPESQSQLKKYMEEYGSLPELGQYLFDKSFSPSKQPTWQQTAASYFQQVNQQFKYFDQASFASISSLYLDCYKFCTYQAGFVEHNALVEAPQRAYKMMLLFGTATASQDHDGDLSENPTIFVAAASELEEKQAHNSGAPLINPKAAIISTIETMERFISEYLHGSQNPIHDLFIHHIPVNNPENQHFNFPAWKQKVLDVLGYTVIKNFADAPRVSKYIAEQRSKSELSGEIIDDADANNIPNSQKAFEDILAKCAYDRIAENPLLARLYKFYNTPEETYNKTLDLMQNGTLMVDDTGKKLLPKAAIDQRPDYIPNVFIPISGGKYYLVKLPSHNLRSMILGHITNCCQSVGGYGEKCVIDGVNLSNNGFYIFIKASNGLDPHNIDWDNFETKDERETSNKIIGQSYAWLGSDNALTIDSLEVLGSFAKELDLKITLEKFGNALYETNPSITRVMIGTGGETPSVLLANNYTLSKSKVPSQPKEGSSYDANEQFEAYTSPKLKEARVELKAITGLEQDHIVSLAHANLIKALGLDYLILLGPNYHYDKWTSFAVVQNCDNPEELIAIHKYLGSLQITNSNHYTRILTDQTIISLLNQGYITFEDLIKDDGAYQLISEGAQALYTLGLKCKEFLVPAIEETERNILKLLAQRLCKESPESLEYIDHLDINTVRALNNQATIELYKAWNVKVADLQDLKIDVIRALASYNAIETYKTGYVTFADLKLLDTKRIELLTAQEALKAYQAGYATFADLKDLSHEYIEVLIPKYYELEGYKAGYIKVSDLKDCSIEHAKILTSHNVLTLYQRRQATVSELKELDIEILKMLTSRPAIWLYDTKQYTLSELKDVPLELFEYLFPIEGAQKAVQAYHIGKVAFRDLVSLEKDRIEALTDYYAIEAYKTGTVTFADLKALGLEYIKALTSHGAVSSYDTGQVKFADLVGYTIEQIVKLTSAYACRLYQTKQVTIGNMTDLNNEKIKALASYDALEIYTIDQEAFANLKDLSQEYIATLTHRSMIPLYKTGKVKTADLKNWSLEQLKILIPDDQFAYFNQNFAASAFEHGLQVSDLYGLNPVQTKALTDCSAIVAYKLGCRAGELLGENAEAIERNILKVLNSKLFKQSSGSVNYIDCLEQSKVQELISDIDNTYLDSRIDRHIEHSLLQDLSIEDAQLLLANHGRFIDIYKNGYIKPQEIEYIRQDNSGILTSYGAVQLYKNGLATLLDLKNLDQELISLLGSEVAIEVCKSGKTSFAELINYDRECLKILTAREAVEAYEIAEVTMTDLLGLNAAQLKLLTDYRAIECYKLGCKISDLLGDNAEAIQRNILKQLALKLCHESEASLGYIEHLDIALVAKLSTWPATELYTIGAATAVDLTDITNLLTVMLLSPEKDHRMDQHYILEAFKTGKVKFADLKALPIEQIKTLTSHYAIEAYKSDHVTCADLRDMNPELIWTYTNYFALEAYKTGVVTITELKQYSLEQVSYLMSPNALECYKLGCKVQELVAEAPEMIQLNILRNLATKLCKEPEESLSYINDINLTLIGSLSQLVILAYNFDKVTLSELKDLSLERIKFYTDHWSSWNMLVKNQAKDIKWLVPATFEDLQILTLDEIQIWEKEKHQHYSYGIITSQRSKQIINCRGLDKQMQEELYSYNAQQAYSKGYVQISDLKACTPEQITALLSYESIETYKAGLVKSSDLVSFSAEVIKELTSQQFLRNYKEYNIKPSDFIGCTMKQIKGLTSWSSLAAYSSSNIKISDLKNLSPERIDAVTSHQALEAIKSGDVILNDLLKLSQDQINILTSRDLLDVYQVGQVTIADFIDLAPDKIPVMASCLAVMTYKTGKVKPADLKDYTIEQIQVLISMEAIKCYQMGWSIDSIVADTPEAINSKIASIIEPTVSPEETKHDDVDIAEVVANAAAGQQDNIVVGALGEIVEE